MNSVLLTQKKRGLYSEIFRETNSELQDAFSQIKDEFEDHLTAINENTNEIQANYELLCNIDQKLKGLHKIYNPLLHQKIRQNYSLAAKRHSY